MTHICVLFRILSTVPLKLRVLFEEGTLGTPVQKDAAPLKTGTQLVGDSKGKAEILIDQFKSVFTKPTNNKLQSTRLRAQNNITPIKIIVKGLEKTTT